MAARSAAGLFADVGAEIACIDPDRSTPLTQYLNHGKGVAASDAVGRALRAAGLIVCEGHPRDLRARRHMLLRVNRLMLCSRFASAAVRCTTPTSSRPCSQMANAGY